MEGIIICNELRKDYLLNRWVVIAIDRSRRPTDFIKPKKRSIYPKSCPLCVGNEKLTPPAILLYFKENGKIKKGMDNEGPRSKKWIIRVVPNLFPAFNNNKQNNCNKKINQKIGVAIGHHEVLVESSNHNEKLASMKNEKIINLINAYIDRLRDLSLKNYVKHVAIFRNYGREAGASLNHAHSQIIAMPFIPRLLSEEIKASKTFFKKNQKCIFCDIIEKEKNGTRLIFQNEKFIVFAPYASIQPFEFWIFPKKHSYTILNLSKNEKNLFAESIRKSFSALKNLLNDPPYNYGFHISIEKKTNKYYHWHLEVYPKLSILAGFEKSTGVFINTISPEKAASELKMSINNLEL